MKSEVKKKKPKVHFPDFTSEAALGFFASRLVIGVDEVGRGCLAGPVVAAAVLLCPSKVMELGFRETGHRPGAKRSHFLFQVRDSKLVPEEERKWLAEEIRFFATHSAVKEASVAEIESLNILYASHLAMERAVQELEARLDRPADAILIDGHLVPRSFLGRGRPLIKGDLKSVSIACASLIAKFYRDSLMEVLDQKYPGYGFREHKGYGTPFHRAQIRALGVSPEHRMGFRGVAEYELGQIEQDFFNFDESAV